MERQVIIDPMQQVTNGDYNNFAVFPTFSLDNLARDAITDGKAFVGFTVTQTGQTEVTVSAGRYWKDGKRFYNADEGGTTIDLLNILPAVTRKIVSIVVWGDEIATALASRGFKNPETGQVFSDVGARERRRVANVDKVAGQENADPQPATIDANILAVAYVLLDTTGIVSVTMIEANRLVSLKTINTRLTLVERKLEQAGSQIDTLRTDLGGLAALIGTRASWKTVTQMAFDLARVMREADMPNDYIGWDSDDFRDNWKSDPARGTYNAVVANGLRFPGTQARAAFVLSNVLDDRIVVNDNMVLAKSGTVKRISVLGKDGEIQLASYQNKTVNGYKLSESRKVVEWTGKMDTAPSLAGWQIYADLTAGPTETAVGGYHGINARSYVRGYVRTNPTTGVQEVLQLNHIEDGVFDPATNTIVPHVTEYWRYGVINTVEDVTWVTRPAAESATGFQACQTFLNSQSGTVAGVNLFFTRAGGSGDVRVMLVQCDANGKPTDMIVSEGTVTAANLHADPNGDTATYVALQPKSLSKGKRYGIRIITAGSHALAYVAGEKFAQGALHILQNDVWNQHGADTDLPFELFFQGYEATRIVVDLEPVTLAGGITYVEANFDCVEPEGTSVTIEVKTTGDWMPLPLPSGVTNPLAAAPTAIQMRAVMLGTTDDMPKFGIGPVRSCVTLRREGTALVHFSEILTLESAADTVEVRLKGYGYDPAESTLAVKILRGAGYATVETVDAVTDLPLKTTADGAFHKSFLFTLGASATSYVVKIEGTASDPGDDFVVTERGAVAYDA